MRAIDAVLKLDYQNTPSTRDDLTGNVIGRFALLERAIRRLLHHHGALARLAAVQDELRRLKVYAQPHAIQVKYVVQLGVQKFQSQIINEDYLYEREQRRLYVQQGLREKNLRWALAEVLHQQLALPHLLPELLNSLLEDPHDATSILERNHIKTLPGDLDFATPDVTVAPFDAGITGETPADLPPVAAPSPAAPPAAAAPHLNGTNGSTPLKSATQLAFDAAPISDRRPTTDDRRPTTGGNAEETKRQTDKDLSRSGEPPPRPPQNGQRAPQPAPQLTQHGQHVPQNGQHVPQNGQHSAGKQERAASPAAARPAFVGRTKMSSPAIPTDWDGLQSRVSDWMAADGITPGAAPPAPPAFCPRPPRVDAPVKTDVARFVLSYAEYAQGFLRLTGDARGLFPTPLPEQVTCVTDFGQQFPLWLDSRRTMPIAYNQTDLSTFFATQSIPAGGIVYLEKVHADRYRLYFNAQPHTVKAVRIAFSEGGQITYETIEEVPVPCETVEAIYRAEKRHEDQTALWLEAVGKKSVEETICDLLMAAPGGWLHEDDLRAMLEAERMVAAGTVAQTLGGARYFVSDGAGNWRLDGSQLLAAPRADVVYGWCKATSRLLEMDDTQFVGALDAVRPPFDALRDRLLRADAAPIATETGWHGWFETLRADPHSQLASRALDAWLWQQVGTADGELRDDGQLRAMLAAADETLWQFALRPILRDTLERLRKGEAYARAAQLAQIWADFDPQHGQDLATLASEAHAWQIIGATPTVAGLLRALAVAPHFTPLHKKLHTAVQLELTQHGADALLRSAGERAAVEHLFAHIVALLPARARLPRDGQAAFDRTVQQQVAHLWTLVGADAHLHLALRLRQHAPTSTLTDNQLEAFVTLVTTVQREPLPTLLLALAALALCPPEHWLLLTLAETLADGYDRLEVWELSNNQPWQRVLSEQRRAALREQCRRNAATHLQRQQRLLTLLDQWSDAALAPLVSDARATLRRQVARDMALVARSAA